MLVTGPLIFKTLIDAIFFYFFLLLDQTQGSLTVKFYSACEVKAHSLIILYILTYQFSKQFSGHL